MNPTPQDAAAVFLKYFEEFRAVHLATVGKELEAYKPLEADKLASVFEDLFGAAFSGIEFLCEIVHRLIWNQCLSNGNHRTTVLFLQAFVESQGARFPWYADEPDAQGRLAQSLQSYLGISKKYLDRRDEFGYGREGLRRQHRAATMRWVTDNVDVQSGALATVGPQRLMSFFSAGVSSRAAD